jgi:AraC family transcriptional regulator
MQAEQWGASGALAPREAVNICPVAAKASRASVGLGWAGLEAIRFNGLIDFESANPPFTHHNLVLFIRPPDELHLRYSGVKRDVPPLAGTIMLVPAGTATRMRSRQWKDSLHVYLEPELVARVAAQAFGIDPARLTVPALDALDLPDLRAAMFAVDAELTAGGAGGRLAAESLANVLAVRLIRHVAAAHRATRGPDGALSPRKLAAVVEYIEEFLDGDPSLEQLAAVAHLSAYHFARQFKAATGLPPHQYVILRRVERAKQLLQSARGLSLAEVAARVGFSDQSQFGQHFKRLVGVTPGQFRTPARIG